MTFTTYSSHSLSSTYIASKNSYFGLPRSSPQYTCSSNMGLANISGSLECPDMGGNLRTSLKSIEFSDGGFHFNLFRNFTMDFLWSDESWIWRTYFGLYQEHMTYWRRYIWVHHYHVAMQVCPSQRLLQHGKRILHPWRAIWNIQVSSIKSHA